MHRGVAPLDVADDADDARPVEGGGHPLAGLDGVGDAASRPCVRTPAAARASATSSWWTGRHRDHGRVDAGRDQRVDVGQDREAAGDAVRVTAGIGDGDELHAGRRPDDAGVVASHRAEPDEAGAQVARHHAPAFATVLTASTMRSRSSWRQRGVDRQRDHLGGGPLGLGQVEPRGELRAATPAGGWGSGSRRPEPTWYSSRSAADELVAVLGDADRVLVVDVRRAVGDRRHDDALEVARRGTRRSAGGSSVQAPTLVSWTRPMAAWMSVIRLLRPMTSLAYWRSMPWLRSSWTRRTISSSAQDDHAALAGGHVLGRVEPEHRERAEGCRPGARPGRAVGLGRVLEEHHAVPLGDLAERGHVGGVAEEVHGHDRPWCAR